jgi:hypothetical protein
MKKIIFSILILMSSSVSFAQESESSDNNEIKFNIPLAIYGLPDLSYERIIEDNMSVGISLAFAVDKPYNWNTNKGIPERSIVCPFYRLYFGQKKAAGFYIEGNMAVASQKELNTPDYIIGGTVTPSKSTTGFGFGAAVGVKLLTKNGFTGDFYGGWGRLFGDNIYNSYPRIGICIGKRF